MVNFLGGGIEVRACEMLEQYGIFSGITEL
jgi:hypothetical protein